MINLIRADLRRVLRRPVIYIFGVLMMFFTLFSGFSEDAIQQLSTEKMVVAYLIAIMASVPVLIGLYGDDFRSGTMITIIGRGVSRTKLMISKLISSAVLLAGYYIVAFGELYVLHTFAIDANYSPNQKLIFVMTMFLGWFRNVALFAFASILMYAFWSVAAGLVTILGLIGFLRIILNAVNQNGNFDLYSVTTDGLIDKAVTAMTSHDFPYQLIIVVIYFVLFIIVGSLFFKRKELDL